MPGGDEILDQVNGGMQFGLMNAFRTGNIIFDVMVCMLVPLIVKAVFASDLPDRITQWLKDRFQGKKDYYIRAISYETKSGGGYYYSQSDDLDSKERNNLLQKAIRLYLSEVCRFTVNNADVFLIPSKKIKLEKDRWGDECRFSGSYQQLMSYQVTLLPAQNVWVEVEGEEDKVWFRSIGHEQEVANGGDNRTMVKTVTFEIKAKGPDGERIVDAWITKVFDWYRAKKASEQDQSRYFLLAQSKKNEDAEFMYKKYILSSHKTFNTLFFPEKDPLLQLVDDFLQKRGKFGIEGFPHKLGLLLDGPPGTGKTSLIKALAQYTKRHIVSVSLDRISTNQELMDMMFDMKFAVTGADEPMVSKMDEIVFVMEDVDAASSVVYARDGVVHPQTNNTFDHDVFRESSGNTEADADRAKSGTDDGSGGGGGGAAAPSRGESGGPVRPSRSDDGDAFVGRTVSAPAHIVRSRMRSKSSGDALTSTATAITAETKSSILQEMANWQPEKERKHTLKYRSQLEKFFHQAEVPFGPLESKITQWCEKQGAVSIMEVFENMASLCKAVDVKPLQSARLKALANKYLGKDKPADDEGGNDDGGGGEGEGGDDQAEAMQSAMWAQLLSLDLFSGGEDGVDAAAGGDSGGGDVPNPPAMPFMGPKNKPYSWQKDKLNLAGLLNVLDGVVDTPGRILVMTTNHPEKLDPALIRPGRINKRLHLGYCSAETVSKMATHYLQAERGMSADEMRRCAEICETQCVTPAWVEQCCAEVESFGDLLERLKRST